MSKQQVNTHCEALYESYLNGNKTYVADVLKADKNGFYQFAAWLTEECSASAEDKLHCLASLVRIAA